MSKQPAQIVLSQARVSKDRSQGAAPEFSLARHDEGKITVRMLESNMASPLAY